MKLDMNKPKSATFYSYSKHSWMKSQDTCQTRQRNPQFWGEGGMNYSKVKIYIGPVNWAKHVSFNIDFLKDLDSKYR